MEDAERTDGRTDRNRMQRLMWHTELEGCVIIQDPILRSLLSHCINAQRCREDAGAMIFCGLSAYTNDCRRRRAGRAISLSHMDKAMIRCAISCP